MTETSKAILNDVIAVVETWMEYMRIIVRTPKVLAEHSLCIPISDYMERKQISSFALEKSHSELSKKRVDLYWENGEEKFYVELKLATGYSSENLSDYYDDLCRLALLCKDNTYCYFLLSGTTDEFYTTFYNTRTSRIRPRKICKWLSLGSPNSADSERTIYTRVRQTDNTIRTKKNIYIDCYYEFLREYEPSYQAIHHNLSLNDRMRNFKTKLISYNNINKRKKDKNSIAIWEIKAL